jgi:hypothetical protein
MGLCISFCENSYKTCNYRIILNVKNKSVLKKNYKGTYNSKATNFDGYEERIISK